MIIKTADKFAVPAGGALAVDRSEFSKYLTEVLSKHPLIKVKRIEQLDIPPKETITILATGPLTSDTLATQLKNFTGIDSCHFFDAASPIIYGDSIDQEIVFKASRYDKGDPAYLNCPLNKHQYTIFEKDWLRWAGMPQRFWEKDANFFEACLPIEEIAERSWNYAIWPPKSIGLWNPKWGNLFDKENRIKKRPYAIVQLRKKI